MSKMNSRQRKARRIIKDQTELMAWLTAGQIKEGAKGTPYVQLGRDGSPLKSSVCFFYATRVFRVFAPHPVDKGAQVKYTFAEPELAAECAKRLNRVGSQRYALWIADGGSEEKLAAAKKRHRDKQMERARAR